MALTQPPAPPSTSSPSDFDAKADAFVAWFPTGWAELDALIPTIDSAAASAVTASASAQAALAATGYLGSSTQSNSLTTGVKTFNLAETGKSFQVNDAVTCVRRGDTNARLRGTVTTFTSGTGAMTITVATVPGVTGGPYSDWVVMLSVFEPPLASELTDVAVAMAVAL